MKEMKILFVYFDDSVWLISLILYTYILILCIIYTFILHMNLSACCQLFIYFIFPPSLHCSFEVVFPSTLPYCKLHLENFANREHRSNLMWIILLNSRDNRMKYRIRWSILYEWPMHSGNSLPLSLMQYCLECYFICFHCSIYVWKVSDRDATMRTADIMILNIKQTALNMYHGNA